MQKFAFVIICVAMLFEFTLTTFHLPPPLRFVPEAISGLVLVYVLIAGTQDGFRWVATKYWVILGALALVVICGIISNDPSPGALITGMRFYFRAAPMLLLGAVLPMTDEQLLRQLKLLLVLAFCQLPVAVYQRWIIISADRFSGDDVRGTLMDSGILSMLLICGALILTGLVLKRRIGVWRYGLLFILLLIPTTINETKVTVVFLPLGLFVVMLVGADPGKRLRYTGLGFAALVVFAAIFVPIYDKMESLNGSSVSIVDFFTTEKNLDKYLVSEGSGRGVGVGGKKHAHRGEAIVVPVTYLAKDPVLLAFGLGLGNASPSQSGPAYEGRYYSLFQNILEISFAAFLLELGVFGVLAIIALNWMIFTDSVAVARRDTGLVGAIAAGWTGVVAIFMVATLYNNFHLFTSVTFLYWYFAGIVCARRMALRYETVGARYANVQYA